MKNVFSKVHFPGYPSLNSENGYRRLTKIGSGPIHEVRLEEASYSNKQKGIYFSGAADNYENK